MSVGPGKYDDICTRVREETKAQAVVLIVINGTKGMGFEVQAPLDMTLQLPALLRIMADQIDQDLQSGKL